MKFRDLIFSRFSKDIGVDLGTANTLVYVRDRGIVINEPSVVAVNKKTGQLLAIGQEAKKMIGKTPEHIVAIKPLRAGVISDFEITEQMLRYFFREIHGDDFYVLPRPQVVIGIPSGVTEVEKKAVEEAAANAGAREVWLVEEPMAAAIGARLPIFEALGTMVVDIGGGTTEVAVISLGGTVTSKTLRIAGDTLTDNIIQFVKDNYNVLIGERSAEEVKITIGTVAATAEPAEFHVRGRDLVSGLPREILLTAKDIEKAIEKSVSTLVGAIRSTVEETPPELIADIMKQGIILTGGGALLNGFADLLSRETGIPVRITDDPLTTVVRGAGIVLENLEEYQEVLVNIETLAAPRE